MQRNANLTELEKEWRNTLFSSESDEVILKNTDEIKNNTNDNGSCGGGKMGFESMLISLLIMTIFVRYLFFKDYIRNKNRF